MRQLTGLDAQFLAVESRRVYGHVGSLAVYDPSTSSGGTLSMGDVCRLVERRLHLLPPFRWRLVEVPFGLDLPYWIEDPDFHLDFHIRDSAVPPPGDDRQVAETVARIFARPLDRRHPLWEIYLIHGLRGDRVALLTKVHHAVVDGVSGNEIMAVLLDGSPEGREHPRPPDEDHGERAPGDLEMLGRGLLSLPRQPLRALRAAPRALPNLAEVPGATAFPGVPTITRGLSRLRRLAGVEEDEHLLEVTTARAPRTCFNGPVSQYRGYAFGSMSLDRVKALKNALGTTVNDVVVALCATAVRTWLQDRGELPDDPLVAMVPVSVRTPEQQGTWGNKVSAMIVPIPTNEADTARRILHAHEVLRTAKQHHAALPADLMTDAATFIPPALLHRAARTTVDVLSRTRPPLNLVISNVPGPREPMYLAGAQLQALFPVSVVVDGVGLNITVLSYRDHLDFGIVTDREQIAEPWELIDRLGAALDELESIVPEPPAEQPADQPRATRRAARGPAA